MNARRPSAAPPRAHQRGAAAVEFALVAALFFMLMIGMIEMGRMLFYWNSAAEATRLGARIAAVCDLDAAAIRDRMQAMLSILPSGQISIEYRPAGCTVDTCQTVTVRILPGTAVATHIPGVPLALELPAFATTLPRESMLSLVGGTANPMCN